MTRACSRSSFPRPYVWRLTSFSLQIWSSAWPLDQPDEIAALTAALSFVTPFANAATRLVLARSIQVALPLATMTAGRLTNLYDLMDSAYDAPEIAAKSRALGHVPIVDPNPRRDSKADAEAEARAKRHAGHVLAEDVRFNERSAAERVNGGSQRQLRRPIRAYARSRQGALAPDVRGSGADRRATDAVRNVITIQRTPATATAAGPTCPEQWKIGGNASQDNRRKTASLQANKLPDTSSSKSFARGSESLICC